MRWYENKPKPSYVALSVSLFLLMVCALLAVVIIVQRVQIYILQKDVQVLEFQIEEENCWYEGDIPI